MGAPTTARAGSWTFLLGSPWTSAGGSGSSVPRAYHHQGAGTGLLEGALAPKQGAVALPAGPVDKPVRPSDPSMGNGALSMYVKAGFAEVVRLLVRSA